jgi:hypothetical protein
MLVHLRQYLTASCAGFALLATALPKLDADDTAAPPSAVLFQSDPAAFPALNPGTDSATNPADGSASNSGATTSAGPDSPVTTATMPFELAPVTPAPPVSTASAKAPGPAKPPPQPWKNCFFDNDFSYKKDPKHTPLFGENFKDVPVNEFFPLEMLEETRISVGGEIRWRYMDENNRLRAPFGSPGRSTYDLVRWRNYLDVKHSDWFRGYIEMIDASTYNNDLPITGIDKNRFDIQNAFVDLKILERDDKPVWFRVGRQELNFGSQRLISPLDWANTRRNFEGLRINSPGATWDLDAWLTHPVNTANFGSGNGVGSGLGVNQNGTKLDSANYDVTFGGAWATYKGIKDHTIHSFFLWDHHQSPFPGGAGFPVGNRYTYGHQWLGNFNAGGGDRVWLTDVEGGYQFGTDHNVPVQAGYFTGGLGHTWKKLPWEPTVWGFYDYASGDNNRNDGVNSTFFQYYGLTHAYMGLIDNIARQNISDINYRVQLKPTKKIQLMAAQHFFQLANSHDRLYTVTGQPIGSAGHGTDIGNEVDFTATYTYNQNLSFEAGYFFFQYGSYVQSVAPRGNADQFYVSTTLKY